MKEIKMVRYYFKIAGILFILACLTSCKKTKYDLLDPASAGVWTLYNTSTGLPGDQVRDIKLDSKGNLWVTFSGDGAATFDNGEWTTYITANSSILSNSVTSMEPASDGSIIIGTTNGLSIRSAAGQWSSFKDPNVTTMFINTVKIASNGDIWVGTENQGFYYNDGSGYVQIYAAAFQNVNIIEEDSYGNIWLGTDNGLLKWDGTGFSIFTTSDGLPSNQIASLYSDSKKRLWVGTSGGATVSWIDNSEMHQLSLMNGNSGTFVRDIFEDRKGDIWFATWFDGLIRYDGVIPYSFKVYNGFYENDVNCIGEDKYGNLWIGLHSKGLVKYTLPLD
jgi:ligand-binding sensor domain-containing protein